MYVIRHYAQRIELKPILFLCFFDGIKKDLTTFQACQAEFPVVATGGDMVAVIGFDLTRLTGHKRFVCRMKDHWRDRTACPHKGDCAERSAGGDGAERPLRDRTTTTTFWIARSARHGS